jgi:hypothetical protein
MRLLVEQKMPLMWEGVSNLPPSQQTPQILLQHTQKHLFQEDILTTKSATSLFWACNQTFTSVYAFDLHRIGSFQKRTRRCMTVEEMQAKGMTQNTKGWWTTPRHGQPSWPKTAQEGEMEEVAL